MRDINRIPEILKELERVWRDNPDFRLGQLVTVAARPSDPHPTTFHIEDDKILEGLKSFGKQKTNDETFEPLWIKHSAIGKVDPETLTDNNIKDLVIELYHRNEQTILTPESILGLIGAPISDKNWMNDQKTRMNKLKQLLVKLESEELLKPVQVGYEINKVPNNGYKA
ncbi:hypothetical protein [Labilibacter marinus]|uniref:hypothetical protein n=1 Tax=Labilibacter marinus TaxID=1477105 RepID=UPI00095016E1|nr:hypothetical protein [Labilibacter marinus]